MDKMDRDGRNVTQRLYRCVLIKPCQNSLWIIGLKGALRR